MNIIMWLCFLFSL